MIYFDYKYGNIVSCNFSHDNSPNEVNGIIYLYLLSKMNIASIHNHPASFASPPSGKNFEMLGLDFEKFELIVSDMNFGFQSLMRMFFSDEEINKIHSDIEKYYKSVVCESNSESVEGYVVIDDFNKLYGDFLLNYFNNKYNNIKLIRRYLDE